MSINEIILIICTAIIVIFVMSRCRYARVVIKKYTNYIKDIQNDEESKEKSRVKVFENDELNEITKKFIKGVKEGVININTEVIIEEGIENGVKKKQSKVEAGGAIAIAFGLLGTFIGLTIAIWGVGDLLQPNITMEKFIQAMSAPMDSMKLAFITTILGVSGSLIINWKCRDMNLEKERFFDLMENYLDNDVISQYQKSELGKLSDTIETQFGKMTNTIEVSMGSLVENMGELFSKGITKLVKDINKSNVDLTDSVEVMNQLVNEFGVVINSFSKPVQKFDESVSEYIGENRGFSEELGRVITNFGEEVSRTEESFILLRESIGLNKMETEKLKNILNEEFTATNDAKNSLAKVVDKLDNSVNKQTAEVGIKLESIADAYKRLNEALVNIDEIVEHSKIATREAVKESSEILKENIVDEVRGSVDRLSGSTEIIKEGIEILCKMNTSINERREYENKIIKDKNNGIKVKG